MTSDRYPADFLDIRDDVVLAIDIGGTKIAAGLVDLNGNVGNRQEVATLAHEGREKILRRVEALGRAVLAGAPIGAVRIVGVASAGQVNSAGQIYYATGNLPGWTGLDLAGAVEAIFELPAAVDNDVNAMALAEIHAGAGRGYRDVLCVMSGTGIGGALIQNGKLYRGARGGAGEFGHLSIQAIGGKPCNCGGQGCVEVYASSRAIVFEIVEAAGTQEIYRRFGKPAEALSFQDIAAAFHSPEHQEWTVLQHVITQAADAMGAGLSAAANLLDPELIILAGSIQLLGDAYLALVRQSFDRRTTVPRRAARLCFSQLGIDSTLLGAALIARQRLDAGGGVGVKPGV